MSRSSAAAGPKERSALRWLLWAALAAFLAYAGVTYARVVRQSRVDDARPADAVIVFGAAQYSGHPSPVFKARLDHGYDLFRRKLAPVVITTGGQGGDPKFSEGGVGRDYLVARGIPDQALIAETQSDDTSESVARVAAIMQRNGMRTCIAVSDPYHLYRIRRMLEREGVAVYTSPRPQGKPQGWWSRNLAVLREVVSYMAWRAGLT
ncbi:MAG: YdcF family protein [Candidatus Koribacter versatilis]|uniref:YdcF family protein n=1 Tax=Candidatus Korobacter versatilis TaxID=658062 RepID=A0A932EPC5_9BACT|nr:YdcF family protein [Candidatus Koribacter versatilis]